MSSPESSEFFGDAGQPAGALAAGAPRGAGGESSESSWDGMSAAAPAAAVGSPGSLSRTPSSDAEPPDAAAAAGAAAGGGAGACDSPATGSGSGGEDFAAAGASGGNGGSPCASSEASEGSAGGGGGAAPAAAPGPPGPPPTAVSVLEAAVDAEDPARTCLLRMLLDLLKPDRLTAEELEEHAFVAHMLRTGASFDAAEHDTRKPSGSAKRMYERALKYALKAGHPVSCVNISATSAADPSKTLTAMVHLLDVRSEVLHGLLYANPYASDGLSNFALSHAAHPQGIIAGYTTGAHFKALAEKTAAGGGTRTRVHCALKVSYDEGVKGGVDNVAFYPFFVQILNFEAPWLTVSGRWKGTVVCVMCGFEFIQEYTGYVSPGIFALFTMGFFWKRTTSKAALFALLGGVTFSIITKFIPTWTGLNDTMFYTAFADETGTMMIPFMDRMGWVFIFCIVSMVVITLSDPESKNNPQGLEIDAKMFKLSPTFIFGTVVICLFLTLVYTYFW